MYKSDLKQKKGKVGKGMEQQISGENQQMTVVQAIPASTAGHQVQASISFNFFLCIIVSSVVLRSNY